MPSRDERAASERATAQIRELATPVRAPQRLRAAVAQERLARGRARRAGARGRSSLAGAAAALVLALVVVLLVGGQADAPGGSVADAAQVALRAPTGAAPARTADGYLRVSNGGITFPDYASAHGWRAVGTRTDQVAGRTAVTVVYARGTPAGRLHDRRRRAAERPVGRQARRLRGPRRRGPAPRRRALHHLGARRAHLRARDARGRAARSARARPRLSARLRRPDARGVRDVAVAVLRGDVLEARHLFVLRRVQRALELAEHDAEQQVPPGRLRERGRVAAELRQLVARRVQRGR